MKNLNVLFLAAVLLAGLGVTGKVTDVSEENDFFNEGHSNNHLVVGFYDSANKPESKQFVVDMLEQFANDPTFTKDNYRFISVDFKNLERIVKHYNVEGHAGLFYYIHNQLQQDREFGPLLGQHFEGKKTKNDVFAHAHAYLVDRHDRIAKELKSLEEYEEVLAKHKIIGVYIGGKSTKGHDTYLRLAYSHIDFWFFQITTPELAAKIYKQVAKSEWSGRDEFLILRHKSFLTDFDPKEMVKIDASWEYEYFKTFLVLERHQKLRNDEHGADIFMDVFHRRVKMILHTYDPSSPHSEVQAYEDAVQRLPKGMFYCNVNTHATWVGHFLQMFSMSNMKMEPNKLYFMYATGHQFHIHEFAADMDEESIYDAVWGVYRKHKDVFNKEEKAIMEGDLSKLTEVHEDL